MSFEVYFVKEGRLLEEAQRLRYKVFFGDNCGKKDVDSYDQFCEHLVVIDNVNNKVVGTYRLLLGKIAFQNIGFYSEQEFDLKNIKNNCGESVLEIGRVCVEPSYRRHKIITLLWRKVFLYAVNNNVRYIFGCASIPYQSIDTISEIFQLFKRKFFSPDRFRVYPKDEKYHLVERVELKEDIFFKIPSLMREYLKMGAWVCGKPFWDDVFKTVDFFMLLDLKRLNSVYKNMFLK